VPGAGTKTTEVRSSFAGTRHPAPGSRHPFVRHPAPGTRHPFVRHPAPGSRHPFVRHPAPGSRHPITYVTILPNSSIFIARLTSSAHLLPVLIGLRQVAFP